MSTEQGKKIDEIRIEWDSYLVVRYHADDLSFTVEAGDARFKGPDIKDLVEKGRVHLNGWSKLKWDHVIMVGTAVYRELAISYQRCFRSKHRNKFVYRHWRIGKENEHVFGGIGREPETGDVMEGGEPGEVMSSTRGERVVPYTPERWMRLRELSKKLNVAMEDAAKRLSKILKDDDLDTFLAGMAGPQSLRLVFDGKAETAEKT